MCVWWGSWWRRQDSLQKSVLSLIHLVLGLNSGHQVRQQVPLAAELLLALPAVIRALLALDNLYPVLTVTIAIKELILRDQDAFLKLALASLILILILVKK